MWCRVKGWSQFQHYKNRKPPWIRLYRDLLDNMEFNSLPVESRALAPMIWLLAAEDASLSGSVNCDVDKLAFRLRCKKTEIESGLQPLIDAGFLICGQSDYGMLATC